MTTLTEERSESSVSYALSGCYDWETDEKIRKILINLGVSPKLDGYEYLCHAILLIMGDGGYLKKMTAILYPTVAKKFAVKPHSVERSIRHAIDSSISSGKMARINNIIGIDVYDKRVRMTNGAFLSILSEKMKSDLTNRRKMLKLKI